MPSTVSLAKSVLVGTMVPTEEAPGRPLSEAQHRLQPLGNLSHHRSVPLHRVVRVASVAG